MQGIAAPSGAFFGGKSQGLAGGAANLKPRPPQCAYVGRGALHEGVVGRVYVLYLYTCSGQWIIMCTGHAHKRTLHAAGGAGQQTIDGWAASHTLSCSRKRRGDREQRDPCLTLLQTRQAHWL